jgi:hypothetical protein
VNNPNLIAKASDLLKQIAGDLESFVEDLQDSDNKTLLRSRIHVANEIADDLSETLMSPLGKELYTKL